MAPPEERITGCRVRLSEEQRPDDVRTPDNNGRRESVSKLRNVRPPRSTLASSALQRGYGQLLFVTSVI